jgi:hypothetical protein
MTGEMTGDLVGLVHVNAHEQYATHTQGSYITTEASRKLHVGVLDLHGRKIHIQMSTSKAQIHSAAVRSG